jgi:hypothetical protein
LLSANDKTASHGEKASGLTAHKAAKSPTLVENVRQQNRASATVVAPTYPSLGSNPRPDGCSRPVSFQRGAARPASSGGVCKKAFITFLQTLFGVLSPRIFRRGVSGAFPFKPDCLLFAQAKSKAPPARRTKLKIDCQPTTKPQKPNEILSPTPPARAATSRPPPAPQREIEKRRMIYGHKRITVGLHRS